MRAVVQWTGGGEDVTSGDPGTIRTSHSRRHVQRCHTLGDKRRYWASTGPPGEEDNESLCLALVPEFEAECSVRWRPWAGGSWVQSSSPIPARLWLIPSKSLTHPQPHLRYCPWSPSHHSFQPSPWSPSSAPSAPFRPSPARPLPSPRSRSPAPSPPRPSVAPVLVPLSSSVTVRPLPSTLD